MMEQKLYCHLSLQYLSVEEMMNPFMVINDFSDRFELPDAKKYVASWMANVHKNKVWKIESPDILLLFYEHILKLIECAWLIKQSDNTGRLAKLSNTLEDIQLMNVDLYCMGVQRKDAWNYFPRSLSRREFINPFVVYTKFFKICTLTEWKKVLHDALHRSLSDCELSGVEEVMDTLYIKKHLDKLIDACYLIEIREKL